MFQKPVHDRNVLGRKFGIFFEVTKAIGGRTGIAGRFSKAPGKVPDMPGRGKTYYILSIPHS
jgi:hypothetical protein